jgi:hypothetical protein
VIQVKLITSERREGFSLAQKLSIAKENECAYYLPSLSLKSFFKGNLKEAKASYLADSTRNSCIFSTIFCLS